MIADAFEADPDDVHIVDFGDGPEELIPSQEPGIIEDLREAAQMMDAQVPWFHPMPIERKD